MAVNIDNGRKLARFRIKAAIWRYNAVRDFLLWEVAHLGMVRLSEWLCDRVDCYYRAVGDCVDKYRERFGDIHIYKWVENGYISVGYEDLGWKNEYSVRDDAGTGRDFWF